MNTTHPTKERLLDAAEAVFAREGYRSASLRAITTQAGVNLAAVNYHYGSKRGLVEAVFARRLGDMNQARVHGLALAREQAHLTGKRLEAHALIATFIAATLGHTRSGPDERNFIALVVRSFSDGDHTVQWAFERYMKPAFDALQGALAEALPNLPDAELWWRLQFALGAMIRVHHIAMFGDTGTNRPPQSPDASVVARLIDFVHAGLSAPPAEPARHPAPPQGESP